MAFGVWRQVGTIWTHYAAATPVRVFTVDDADEPLRRGVKRAAEPASPLGSALYGRPTLEADMRLGDLEARGIPRAVLEQWQSRHARANSESPDQLTGLQSAVLCEESFWSSSENLIVQGPPCSGKTLVAEVAALHCNQRDSHSTLYIVPFRAMVGEKWRAFEAAMGRESLGLHVYPSSSDYQEHDGFLVSGDYDIGVMVYEKLFALMAQPKSNILQKCGILIVDECQMVSHLQRGPKLEVIMARVLAERRERTRIMGLTGTACDVRELARSLRARIVADGSRPKPLLESICTFGGKCRIRYDKPDGSFEREGSEAIALPDGAARTTDEAALRLARYHLTLGHKVLVFRSSQARTVKTAQVLARSLDPSPLPEELLARLEEVEDDDVVPQLRDRLLPHGVAYHNASLSWDMRDLIEDEFRADGGAIRAVVATETLAIGVNLPADVVVIADLVQGLGAGGVVDITAQEYKNYVGRAGRYGQGTLDHGRSYIIAEHEGRADSYWQKYVTAKPTPIPPAFRELDLDHQAPYVLNWIGSRRVTRPELAGYLSETFSYGGDPKHAEGRLAKLLKCLAEEKLATLGEQRVEATSSGEALAGFALSLESVRRLRNLREMLSTQDAMNLPILDVLFEICRCDEIEALRAPALTNPNDMLADQPLRSRMRESAAYIVAGGALDTIRCSQDVPNAHDLLAMKRAVLLYAWRTGQPVREMRRACGLEGFTIGDLGRMADMAGYLIEALAALAAAWDPTQPSADPLKALARTVHYGVPERAVRLMAKHVRGINRTALGRLCEAVPDRDLVNYVLINRYKQIPHLAPGPLARLAERLAGRLNQPGEAAADTHRRLVSNWVRQNILGPEWPQMVLDVYSATTAEDLADALHCLLAAAPLRLACHAEGGTHLVVSSSDGSCGSRLAIVSHVRDEYLTWPAIAPSIAATPSGIPHVVVGVPDCDDDAVWRLEHECDGAAFTREALLQACMISIHDTRTGVPLLRCLTEHRGRVRLENVAQVMERFAPTGGESSEAEAQAGGPRDGVFLCHAATDSERYVKPVAEELRTRGVPYWLDDAQIEWGDLITAKVNDGLRSCRYVVVFLSSAFLDRQWPNAELGAALNKQNRLGQKVVLPVLIEDPSAIAEKYPALADIRGLEWSMGAIRIAEEIERQLGRN